MHLSQIEINGFAYFQRAAAAIVQKLYSQVQIVLSAQHKAILSHFPTIPIHSRQYMTKFPMAGQFIWTRYVPMYMYTYTYTHETEKR